MAKFAMECPRCGSLNTASTFVFAKKVIQCGTCGEEINVKQSRMTSKRCPGCGKVVVCDQAKLEGKKCPSCGSDFGVGVATADYKMARITCPQCSCMIEVNKTQNTDVCPVCDKVISVQEELAKEAQKTSTKASVIKYEGDNSTFVWKHPIEDFNLGSQLIVHESQEALFFLNGQALDLFGPGRHSLETENLPILKTFYNLPVSGDTPFHAEVYFINKTVQMALKWGTDERVRFIEPSTGIPLDIGASGEMNLQVSDARKLLIKLVGTTKGIAWDSDTHEFTKTLRDTFKPLIRTTVKSNLAAAIKTQQINILEIDEKLEALSLALGAKISEGFEEYGLCVPQFYVTNVALPEDDKNFKRLRSLLSDPYLSIREAQAMADITAAQRKVTLEQETTLTEVEKQKAQRTVIAAQAEANKRRLEGLADADVMAAQGYNQKDVLQAEVQKAYAEGIGNMGSGEGGGSSMLSEMMGLGVGMAAMGTMSEQFSGAMAGFASPAKAPSAEEGWLCSCGTRNTGKFCSECGKMKAAHWDCPACGNKDNAGKFCSECGKMKPEDWTCPACGAVGNHGKFCSECGKAKEENQ